MGNSQQTSSIKINYEDIQFIIKNKQGYLLINTLYHTEQTCLILNTININDEETIINNCIKQGTTNIKIVIYGKNNNDERVYNMYNQFISLGFYNIYIYIGGLFEWMLLQDIYGENEFPTTKKECDLLKFKPHKTLGIQMIEY